jgi:hypothetical protein
MQNIDMSGIKHFHNIILLLFDFYIREYLNKYEIPGNLW